MRVSRSFTFDAAHMLDTHDGKCKNLHGHTYRLEVCVKGDLIKQGPKAGMVIDFADLKSIVNAEIIDRLDHALLYDETNPQESELASLLQKWQRKTYAFSGRTTAENMSVHIYDKLVSVGLMVDYVRLYETPSSFCEYGA